jgi:hypothetical protein
MATSEARTIWAQKSRLNKNKNANIILMRYKNRFFFLSPQFTYPDGIAQCKKLGHEYLTLGHLSRYFNWFGGLLYIFMYAWVHTVGMVPSMY